MIEIDEIEKLIGQPESLTLEYKAVLPPSRRLGLLLSAFANAEGGYIILGIVETNGSIEVKGLSEDFHANSITSKAIQLLTPSPKVDHQYIEYQGKKLYVIKVEKSSTPIVIGDKVFERHGDQTTVKKPEQKPFHETSYLRIKDFFERLELKASVSSGALTRYIEHFQSILNIVDDLKRILYPINPTTPTTNQEGKILTRILFSSCADNFETYLSDLLYEIYLAKPETLRSEEQVSVKEILSCNDIDEFISFWAKKKISKLQRGSVKGFIADNKQISSLNVIEETEQIAIEKILQIRHLYSHKNGITDEKFLVYYPDFTINTEHQLSIDSMLEKMEYLTDVAKKIDDAAINKFRLATIN
ncbi:MAG: ATP-binding protein [Bacteriovoracaceae bacterium]|jgi:hypothetical protein|nr:ATP-binding protein [Bacteriovoracaceae bacterium]